MVRSTLRGDDLAAALSIYPLALTRLHRCALQCEQAGPCCEPIALFAAISCNPRSSRRACRQRPSCRRTGCCRRAYAHIAQVVNCGCRQLTKVVISPLAFCRFIPTRTVLPWWRWRSWRLSCAAAPPRSTWDCPTHSSPDIAGADVVVSNGAALTSSLLVSALLRPSGWNTPSFQGELPSRRSFCPARQTALAA
ncbi:hypothetical protein SAMN05428959_1149 [Duganella sp. CF517]|nr:hypothetical protein SAMN05428959_1149 [Duganella sp. CF517]